MLIRSFLPAAALALACGGPDPQTVDMTFRVSLEWLEKGCTPDATDLETTLIDIVPDDEGTHDLRFRHQDAYVGPFRAGIEIKEGEVHHRNLDTSHKGNGSLTQTIDGKLTGSDMDLTVVTREDGLTDSATGRTTICVDRYRLRGAARPYGDPASADGMFRGTYVGYGSICDGSAPAEMSRERVVLSAGPAGEDRLAVKIARRMLFVVGYPHDGNIGPGVPQQAYYLDGGAFPLGGFLFGGFTPDLVEVQGFLLYVKDQMPCVIPFDLVEGKKLIPDAAAFDNEYRVRKTLTDSCGRDDPPPPWTDLIEVVSQADGSLLLFDGDKRVPIRVKEDGRFEASATTPDGYVTLAFDGTLKPPLLNYTITNTTRYGRECVRTTGAKGRVRFIK